MMMIVDVDVLVVEEKDMNLHRTETMRQNKN